MIEVNKNLINKAEISLGAICRSFPKDNSLKFQKGRGIY